jgi:MFS family permease
VEADAQSHRWTLVAVCTTTFMLLLDITIVNVALPSIQRRLHAGLTGLEWVVDAYALTLAALILTAGALSDRYGRRLLFGSRRRRIVRDLAGADRSRVPRT